MNTKDEGGAAFPVPNDAYNNDMPGMSLRDWFAGMAMQGILAADSVVRAGRMDWPYTIARGAYQIADIMLEVREANND